LQGAKPEAAGVSRRRLTGPGVRFAAGILKSFTSSVGRGVTV
jgi:hypothetical protein